MKKIIKKQDCGWKQQVGNSGETSINLSNEICEFLSFGLIDYGEEIPITFLIYKEDCIEALKFIRSQCPLYRTTSKTCEIIYPDSPKILEIERNMYNFFDVEKKEYTVTLYRRKDGRIYLKNLRQRGFSIRDFLIEDSSALVFEDNVGIFEMRIISAFSEV